MSKLWILSVQNVDTDEWYPVDRVSRPTPEEAQKAFGLDRLNLVEAWNKENVWSIGSYFRLQLAPTAKIKLTKSELDTLIKSCKHPTLLNKFKEALNELDN